MVEMNPTRVNPVWLVLMVFALSLGGCSSAVEQTGFEQEMTSPTGATQSSTEGLLEQLNGGEGAFSPADVGGDDEGDDAGAAPTEDTLGDTQGPLDDSGAAEGDSGAEIDGGDAGPELDSTGDTEEDVTKADASAPDAGADALVEDASEDALDDSSDTASEDVPEPEPECESDDECASPGDEAPCLAAACDDGDCVLVPTEGNACDDGDPCTVDDHCELGECVASEPFDCNDGDPCTDDACWAGVGCVNQPALCDDGDPCTIDTCEPESGCVSTALICPPSDNACIANACDSLSGECVAILLEDGLGCDDKDGCTADDSCSEGECVGESVCACEQDADCEGVNTNLCAGQSVCDLMTNTCVPDPTTAVVCPASDDPCVVTTCEPASGTCIDVPLEEGTVCDTLGPCDASATCLQGLCVTKELVCDDGDPCTVDACDPESGACTHLLAQGAPCDDANACTKGETCGAEGCGGGENVCECQEDADCSADYDVCAGVPFCNDDNTCEVDPSSALQCAGVVDGCQEEVCSTAAGGCVLVDAADGLACEADPCFEQGACLQGACIGVPLDCGEDEACLKRSCDLESGGCVEEALNDVACDDGNACTGDDVCDSGLCIPGASICECEEDSDCVEGWDYCLGLPGCDAATNTCQAYPDTAPDCDVPTEACVVAGCDPADGTCTLANAAEGTPCDDADPCTLQDVCSAGVCTAGISDPCDDGNACTTDSCAPESGCQHTPLSCADDNLCTSEACDPSVGCLYAGVICQGPGVPCVIASCDPAQGCVDLPVDDGVGCNDGDPCTFGDSCSGGACLATEQVCDDGLACTLDACEGGTCVYTPVPSGTECDDGNACTSGDTCNEVGLCLGAAKACDDGLACTTGNCVDGVCTFTPLTGLPCDDSDFCTGQDTCQDGTCVGDSAEAPSCDDDDACTQDACIDGACTHEPIPGCDDEDDACEGLSDGAACDDGDASTSADICLDGVCAGFEAHEVSLDIWDVSLDAGLDTRLTGVGYAQGHWYALGISEGAIGTGFVGGAAIVQIDDPEAPVIMTETLQTAAFTDIHGRVAVDAEGKVWWLEDGEWSDDSLLSDFVEDSGEPSELHVVTSIQRQKTLRVWMQGRSNSEEMYTRVCDVVLKADNSILSVDCDPIDWPFNYISDAGGIAAYSDCGSDCLDALLVSGGNAPADFGGYYNDVYESYDGLNDWTSGYYDGGNQNQLIRDVVGYDAEQFLVVGTRGHMRHRHPSCGNGACQGGIGENGFNCPSDCNNANSAGAWSYELSEITSGLAQRDLSGAWAGGGAVLVSAHRVATTDSLELWSYAQDVRPTAGEAWTTHTLVSSAGGAGELGDVWGLTDGRVMAVGSGRLEQQWIPTRRALVFLRNP